MVADGRFRDETAGAGSSGARTESGPRSTPGGRTPGDGRKPEPFEPLLHSASDLAGYATHYLSAHSALMRLRFRRMLVVGVAWLFGRIALYVAIGYAMFLVLHGLAGGVAELCGDRMWAGNLITGTLFLAILGIAVSIGSKKFIGLERRQIEEHYAHRRKVQEAAARHADETRTASQAAANATANTAGGTHV